VRFLTTWNFMKRTWQPQSNPSTHSIPFINDEPRGKRRSLDFELWGDQPVAIKITREAPTLAGGRQSGSILTCWIYDQQLEFGAFEWVITTSILPWSVIFNRLKTFHGFRPWLVKSWNLCRSENIILSATEM